MKDFENRKDPHKDPTATKNIDEGLNEATRLGYTDSVSTAASKQPDRKGKNKNSRLL